MQVREFRQLLLGEAPFEAERPHTFPGQNPWIRSWQRRIMRGQEGADVNL